MKNLRKYHLRLVIYLEVSFLIFTLSIAINGQKNDKKVSSVFIEDWSLIDVNDRDAKNLKFTDVQKLPAKIHSRKNKYEIGELLNLDFAVLNLSEESLFIPNPSAFSLTINIVDENNKSFGPFYFVISQIGYTSDSFKVISSSDILSSNVIFTLGCQESDEFVRKQVKIYQDTEIDKYSERGKRMFDENAFVSWGSGCINISQNGTYKVLAKLENNKKIVLSKSRKRTLIGNIEFTPFTFEVKGN